MAIGDLGFPPVEKKLYLPSGSPRGAGMHAHTEARLKVPHPRRAKATDMIQVPSYKKIKFN